MGQLFRESLKAQMFNYPKFDFFSKNLASADDFCFRLSVIS